MEHRSFHYGVLAVIGTAHLALLWQAGNPSLPIRLPEPFPMQVVSIDSSPSAPPVPTVTPRPKPAAAVRQPASAQRHRNQAAVEPLPRQLADNAPAVAPPQPAVSSAQPSHAEQTATAGDAAPAAPAAEPAITPPTLARGYLNNPKPEYPPASLELDEEGTVYLRISVNNRGKATAVGIARSSGFPRLDNSARRAAANWTFHPAMRGNEPVDYSYVTPIQFVLPNKNRTSQP